MSVLRLSTSYLKNVKLKGGTIIGTKRCMEFMTKEGRMKATKNMISLGIGNLVVIGGDGSLSGANIFREEWPSYIDELLRKGDYCLFPLSFDNKHK